MTYVTLRGHQGAIDSPYECEHNNPDSLDARLFTSVVLAVTPAVTMHEASPLSGVNPCLLSLSGVNPLY